MVFSLTPQHLHLQLHSSYQYSEISCSIHGHGCSCWLARREMTPGPQVKWNEVGWTVRWGWCGPAGGLREGGQPREWRLWRKGVKVDLQWGQVAELWELYQELSYLEGCRPHIPGGQIRGMSGTAKEVEHRVVCGAAIGAGGELRLDRNPALWATFLFFAVFVTTDVLLK